MSGSPTPEQMSAVMASDNPILAVIGLMPDEQLQMVAEYVQAECDRRGLNDEP